MHTSYTHNDAHEMAVRCATRNGWYDTVVVRITRRDSPTDISYETWDVVFSHAKGSGPNALVDGGYSRHVLVASDEGEPHMMAGEYDLESA
jgi:hypothetical protein